MTSMQEYMIADFARALAESGTSVVIDGETLPCFSRNLSPDAGMYPGVIVVRFAYWLAIGALSPLPPMGSEIIIDDIAWTVELSLSSGASDHMVVWRNLS